MEKKEYAPPLRGIIFDLDGTLYQMKWFFKPLLTMMLLPQSLLLPRYMKVRKRYAGKEHECGESLLLALAEDLAVQNGTGNSRQMHQWIHRRFYRAFESAMPLLRGSRPGLQQTLSRLRGSGIKLAVLSDFDRVTQRLRGLHISPDLFDTLASTESLGCLKPSPKSFLSIAEQWNIQPQHILVIGDRSDTDGAGAHNSGMRFVQITDSPLKNSNALCWKQIRTLLHSFVS
ncbi:MAG: HAD family hydrolase [Chitinivibrionales bacterium]